MSEIYQPVINAMKSEKIINVALRTYITDSARKSTFLSRFDIAAFV